MTEQGSDRLASIAASIGNDALTGAASAALGIAEARLSGRPRIVPLSAHHYDSRTIGMLHVIGQAMDASDQVESWSCVIKVLDLTQVPRANSFVDADHEILVYRHRLFAEDGDAYRPARCYLISEGPGATTLLWLEDLTGLQKPPFTLEELNGMSAHLGAWNARHATSPPTLPFEARTNTYLLRWSRSPAVVGTARLHALEHHPYVRDAFRDSPLAQLDEYVLLAGRLNEITSRLAPSLCFGDCNVGNLFSADSETVAVDWASLAYDPIGVDAGCMIGSSISWGRDGAAIARDERDLFDTYARSLAEAGFAVDTADIRRAYLGQYGFYVCFCAAMPALLVDEVFPIRLVEQRFGARAEDIPHLVAGVIDLIPDYVGELRELVG